MSTNRKTLTIKSKPIGMWQTPSQVEQIEKKLVEATRAILESYQATPASSYIETFRKNSTAVRQISGCINQAYQDIQTAVKFPTQTRQVFEKLCEKVQEKLKHEVGAELSFKFQEALHNFMHPKEALPKVSLTLR